jgi:O-antigen biosynthesis protein
MWLVHAFKPRNIVELGTHFGFSYFSMCQAVKEAQLATKCYAVDTWVGDEHATFYAENVFEAVCIENRKYEAFSTLLRKTFDEALGDIEDGSVDLLHVDGRHFYDDVKHDFETWVPKLSDRAVVLFHDTAVQGRGFGVYKYWAEISEKFPSFNFTLCHGLGVLVHGSDVAPCIQQLLAFSRANGGPGLVESFFESAGSSITQRRALEARIEKISDELQRKDSELINKNAELVRKTFEFVSKCAEVVKLESYLNTLTSNLVDARSRPLKHLNRLIASRVLSALSKASPPITKRAARRFASSAAKRDPKRIEIQSHYSKDAYAQVLEGWALQRNALRSQTLALASTLANGPLFSIIVPVYNTEPKLLQAMIASVTSQSYANWELCIADDASPDPEIKAVLYKAAETDHRIKVVFRTENGHISHASNSAIEISNGDFLVLLDHDDLLDPDALLYLADCINRHPTAKIIYTDEDKVRDDGSRYEPHFKPDWNRELLYSCNYISHLGIYSADLVKNIGGFRPGYEGAQDHDLVLRCLPFVSDEDIRHIPKVLYSWRASPGSTAESSQSKPYAWAAGVRAISDALSKQSGQQVEVAQGPFPFTYVPQWPLCSEPKVTIVIPTRDRLDITRVTVNSILEHTEYSNYEIVIVDNGSIEPETLAWFTEMTSSAKLKVIRDDNPFNYSALNNKAIAQTDGDIVALLNNDIEIISPRWLREMVSLANRPDVGCVGAKLYYPDDTIQHAGVVLSLGGVANHSHKHLSRADPGYFGRLILRQEYSAVTAACLVVRRSVYEAVGGLNEEHLVVAFNDVDFCLKVKAAGYRNIWTPFAEMYHHESASRKTEDTPAKQARFQKEVQYMIDTWQTDTMNDPAYNPNLSKDFEDFRYGPPRW